jgi:hypothetical protein
MAPKLKADGVDYTGLRPRPQMEQIVDYLANGQPKVKFPNREAKRIREHPYMTQLDFFDMQDSQKTVWEDQKRKEEAKRIAGQTQTSQAMELVKTTRSRKDTGIIRAEGENREQATERYNREVDMMRSDPDRYREYDAESKTLRTQRAGKSESIAQTVRCGLNNQAARAPDKQFQGPTYDPSGIRVQNALRRPIEAGEREPVRIGVGERVPMSHSIGVGGDVAMGRGIGVDERVPMSHDISVGADEAIDYRPTHAEDMMGNALTKQQEKGMISAAKKAFGRTYDFLVPGIQDKETEEAYRKMKDDEAYIKERKALDQAESIHAFLDAQARKSGESALDRGLNYIAGSSSAGARGGDEEDPSSSSASAVRPSHTVKAQGGAAAGTLFASPKKSSASGVQPVLASKVFGEALGKAGSLVKGVFAETRNSLDFSNM